MDNVRCSSWAHWKVRSVFLVVTAEALQAKIDRKSAISLQHGQFNLEFQVEGVAPTNHFAWVVRPINAVQFCPDSFHTKKLVADSPQAKCDFRRKSTVLSPLWGA